MVINNEQYNYVIAYGIGQYYERIKALLPKKIKFDFLCDKKWANCDLQEYDGIPIIQQDKIKELKNALIVITVDSPRVQAAIRRDLETSNVSCVNVQSVLQFCRKVTGSDLKKQCLDGRYEDERGNKVYFDETISDAVTIYFQGENNMMKIEKDVLIGTLVIYFGNNGYCSIGKNTEIIGAEFNISEAKIEIGRDCLFSTQIFLRTHDYHHIFDKSTHKRINYPKDIVIGDQVWIAFRVTLLGGAHIGSGSIVGTNSVTSSRFGRHQIIAGVPARTLRENVCWSRDNTEFFNHDYLEECVSQDALRYL